METVHLGTSVLELDIPGKNLAFNLSANEIVYPEDEAMVLRQSLHNPVGSPRLRDIVSSNNSCLLYTSPSPRDRQKSRMPSSA